MNIQSGKFKNTRKPVNRANGSIGEKLVTVFKIALLLVALASVLNGYIYLNQKIAETEREIRRTAQKIDNEKREIDQLRIQREKLSAWSNIRLRIAQFNLKLRPPQPGQVEKMTVLTVQQAAAMELGQISPSLPVANNRLRRN